MLRSLVPHWRGLVVAVCAAVLAELSAVALTGTAAWLIARAAQQPPLAAIALAIVVVRALSLGRGVLRYVDRLLGHDAVLAAVADLRTTTYQALRPLAPARGGSVHSGEALTGVVADVDALQDLVLRCLTPAAVAAAVGVTASAVAALIVPAAGVVLACGMLCAAVLSVLFAGDDRRREADLSAATVDLVRGAADLAAFGASARFVFRGLGRRRPGWATAAIVLTQGLTATMMTRLDIGSAVLTTVLTVLALAVFDVVLPLPAAARTFTRAREAASRLARPHHTPPPVDEPENPVPAPSSPVTVELAGLRVPGVLDDVTLTLEPGRKVAVVGPSGSGKSTLLAVLMRFVEYEGQARLNGHELRAHDSDDVRRVITGLTQDAHVFHASVRANLTLAKPDATDDELRAVAAKTRLLDWIESLPRGWDTVVGEGMSGGQRRRLLLARALLADPPVLLLDEPTEGLDAETADAILRDVLADDRTCVLVTHRPAGLAAVDEVLALDRGRLVAQAEVRSDASAAV